MITNHSFKIAGAAGKPILGDVTADETTEIKGTIIFLHGFKGFKDWGAHGLTARWFAERGFRYIKFNLSHSGVAEDDLTDITDLEAFGANTFSIELADLDLVINYVCERYAGRPLTLIGHSRGGGLCIIQAARDKRIDKLVTWASIKSFRNLWKLEQEEHWKNAGVIYIENARTKQKMPLNSTLLEDYISHEQELDILSAAARIAIPWLILHGVNDPGVPVATAEALHVAQPKARLVKIPGADHVFNARHPPEVNALPGKLEETCLETLKFINTAIV